MVALYGNPPTQPKKDLCMSKMYYYDPKKQRIFSTYRKLAEEYDVCEATILQRVKSKRLEIVKLTQKEVLRRATLYTKMAG